MPAVPEAAGGVAGRSGARISADRLGSTLFVAALAHGVLILGITFSSPKLLPESAALPSLQVTLIVDTNSLDEPQHAEWLAQADHAGGGSPNEGLRPTTTLSADSPTTRFGDPAAADVFDGRPREPAAANEILTRGQSPLQINAVPKAEAAAEEHETRAALLDRTAAHTLALEIDDVAALPASDSARAESAPSTRESVLAAYLDTWRRRVERIGTLNFPATLRARDGIGRPLLEVAIGADGSLAEAVVRRSSGDSALDQAALAILRLAAPFDPLPAEIRTGYETLRFAYEWDFSGRAVQPAAALSRGAN